jgi:hypothetical protein
MKKSQIQQLVAIIVALMIVSFGMGFFLSGNDSSVDQALKQIAAEQKISTTELERAAFASKPSGVPAERFARKISPVEICGIVKWAEMNSACVPLPAPGGPTSTRRISARSLRMTFAATGSQSA